MRSARAKDYGHSVVVAMVEARDRYHTTVHFTLQDELGACELASHAVPTVYEIEQVTGWGPMIDNSVAQDVGSERICQQFRQRVTALFVGRRFWYNVAAPHIGGPESCACRLLTWLSSKWHIYPRSSSWMLSKPGHLSTVPVVLCPVHHENNRDD